MPRNRRGRIVSSSNRQPGRPALERLEDRCLLADFTLQLLHASDLEGGVDSIVNAPNFAAVVDHLEDSMPNTVILSSGDNYIPGPFFNAGGDPAVQETLRRVTEQHFGLATGTLSNLRTSEGRIDVAVMNVIGFDASALGNHEFDAGTTIVNTILATDLTSGTALDQVRWFGAQFPYLSSNLDFSGDPALAGRFTSQILPNTAFQTTPTNLVNTPKLAPATIVEVNGERIGVVGVTTPLLEQISSPLPTRVKNPGAGTNNMAQLATIVQPVIDQLTALGINKIVLTSHLQQIQLEQQLVPLLRGVDIVMAGGSSTLLADGDDVLRQGDVAAGPYPIQATNADGHPVAIVNTDEHYEYVGRLIVTFDDNGVIRTNANGQILLDPATNGVYATTDQTVTNLWGSLDAAFAPGTKGNLVRQLTQAVQDVVIAKDSVIYGKSDVYLNGLRGSVRTEETNLGNLTADANLAAAKAVDPTVVISIKNGGGIRDSIGFIDTNGNRLPTQPNPLSGKQLGEISQLDVENSLRFNNLLSFVTLSAADLLAILEHGVADSGPGRTPGRFPQIGGLAFSYDLSRPVGDRVISASVKDAAGNTLDVIVENGQVKGNANRSFRVVTLNFLASGGDGYPFPALSENRVDTTLGEQAALASYLQANFAATPFKGADTSTGIDGRIQNLAARSDTATSPPVADPSAARLTKLGTYTAEGGETAAEISAYDPATKRLFVVNAARRTVEIVDISNPTSPVRSGVIDIAALGGIANSVDVENGLVAVAIEGLNKQDNGVVAFFDTAGTFLRQLPVGALPDMLTFTPDGRKVVVANEGEPNSYGQANSVDPVGSVSIIDLSNGLANATVTTAGFEAFNGMKDALIAQGVRLFGPGATVAQDLEPEYVTVSADSRTAWVTLQEANALAVVDLTTSQVTSIIPLGLKDHSRPIASLESYTFTNLPVLGTTPAGQAVDFGGFSGLFFEGYTADGKLKFLTNTDRGPNGEPVGQNRPFLLPNFAPELVRFTLDPATGALTITQRIQLRDQNGQLLTGLSNINIPGANGNTPYQDEIPVDLRNNVLPTQPLGGDFEGVVVDPRDGSYWLCDEYRPAIYHFDATGRLIERLVPIGTAAAAGAPPGTFGTEVLPAILAQRRQNRGFEAIAFDAGKVYAFVQSPMRNPTTLSNATLNGLRNIRIVEFDTVTRATRQFLYVMDNPAPVNASDTRADKIGDAVALGNGEFLVVERDDDAAGTGGVIQKKVYRFSLAGATNLDALPSQVVNGLGIDQMAAGDLTKAGVVPVTKRLHVDLNEVGYDTVQKVEGLALIDANTIAVINDNDFGVAGIVIDPSTGTFTRVNPPEPVVLGVISTRTTGLDASDRDNAINVANWPVRGMYQPDTIATATVGGQTYLVTANEGDARDYTGFAEEVRVSTLQLDPAFFPNAVPLKANAALGRLTVTRATGISPNKPLTATLNAAQEVPPSPSTATATAILSLDPQGTALAYSIVVRGLDFGAMAGVAPRTPDTSDDVTLAHVHSAARGANGMVVHDILGGRHDDDVQITFNADGTTTVSGIWEPTDGPRPVTDFAAILQAAQPGQDVELYFNIHTMGSPGGAIRGQLQGTATPIYSQVQVLGARSFSVLTPDGRVVWDSGDEFERVVASLFPSSFNVSNNDNAFDSRSDNKGPEPEGLTLGQVGSRLYAFIGMERHSGVMVYDVTDPEHPKFVQYLVNRDFSGSTPAGDLGPEGMLFIAEQDSPTGSPLLVVSNEISGTVTIYQVVDPNRVVTLPSGDGASAVTLRKNGDDVELVNTNTGATIFTQPLALTNSLTIRGTANEADTLTVDYAFGGAFTLPGGVAYDGGTGAGDTLAAVGTPGADVWRLTPGLAQLGALAVTVAGVEATNLDAGAGNDWYALAAPGARVNLTDPAGRDTLDFSNLPNATLGVVVNLGLSGGQAQAVGYGMTMAITGTFEDVIGTDSRDVLVGNDSSNKLAGGGGTDVIDGMGGGDVLLGGAGNDTINGSAGNDILVGGLGSDTLVGLDGDDILIGGTTTFDDDAAALDAILAVWTSGGSYAERVTALRNGPFPLRLGDTVRDDGVFDVLFGGGGQDWFFGFPIDLLTDRQGNEENG